MRTLVRRTLVMVALVPLFSVAGGCVIVPQNRRAHLADPMMSGDLDALEAHKRQKFFSSREGAAGGDGTVAGGGCSCQ